MKLRTKLITGGDGLGVTLAEFKEHIKWDADDTSEDVSMSIYIKSATKQAEAFTGRVIQASTYESTIDYWPGCMKLDVIPVDLDSLVVKYTDPDGAEQTLADTEYTVIDNGADEYAEIKFDGTMPSLDDIEEPITLEYDAGYAATPDAIKLGILLLAASYFENRQNEVTGGVSSINYGSLHAMYPYKMMG
jgi:uncharacterized phiE125 gp8 family phage protein